MIKKINLQSTARTQFLNITSEVQSLLETAGVKEGLCVLYVPHTTAGLTINESADPSVVRDILAEMNKVIPFRDSYAHMEGNSAAHIKSSLVGISCQIPIEQGRLILGTWQGVFFCEFDGPRQRTVNVKLIG